MRTPPHILKALQLHEAVFQLSHGINLYYFNMDKTTETADDYWHVIYADASYRLQVTAQGTVTIRGPDAKMLRPVFNRVAVIEFKKYRS